MSFIQCILDNIELKKISKQSGEKAIRAYNNFWEDAKKHHGDTPQAMDEAAQRTIAAVTKLNDAKVWARVNEIRKTAALYQQFKKSDAPDRELIKIGDMLESAQLSVLRETDAIIWRLIEEHRPRFAGLYRPAQRTGDIVRAIYGENVKDEAARQMGRDWLELEKMWRRRANLEGASLEEPPAGRLSIVMDNTKLRKRAKAIGIKKARKEFIDDHMDRVDWSLLDTELVDRSKEQILGDRFDTYFSEGNNHQAQGFHATALTDRLNGKNRMLYYVSATAWNQINDKYGAGNAYQQLISLRETWSKDIALLKTFGPNPELMIQHLTRDTAGAGIAMYRSNLVTQKTNDLKLNDRTRKEARALRERIKIFSHLVANGENSTIAQVVATSRSLVMTGILDGAFIANLGDLGFGHHQAAINNIPAMGYVRKALGQFMAMPLQERRIHALRSGMIGDGMTQLALNAQRYLGAFDGYRSARMISDIVYRAQGLNALTQAARWAWAGHLMGHWADNRKVRWKDLRSREMLERYGITEDEWDIFRSTKVNAENGYMLRPIDLLSRKDINPIVAQRISDKFFDVLNDTGKRASPSVDTRTQVALGYAADANTFRGQYLRTTGALKSFPMFILITHLQDGWVGATPRERLGFLTRFVVTMTIAGAMITQMKEIAAGRDPRDMTDPAFWLRALLNGGSLGFLGDAILSNVNTSRGGGLADMIAGPYLEFVSDFRDTVGSALTGDVEKLQKGAAELGQTIIPVPWQLRLAVERHLWDEIMEMAYPRSRLNTIRRERKRLLERNQGTWWSTGEGLTRGPDLGAVYGGASREPFELFREAFE